MDAAVTVNFTPAVGDVVEEVVSGVAAEVLGGKAASSTSNASQMT